MNALKTIKRVVVGVSGGVDSAVAVLLLKWKGYDVVGAFMKNWDLIDEQGVCTQNKDLDSARFVCSTIGIELIEVDFVKEYWHSVFSELIDDYQNGLTPNPDILCNRHIKFNAFFKYATTTLAGDTVATGHYARNSLGTYLEDAGSGKLARLLKGKDLRKDQTFFLSQISQEALQKTMFPIGGLSKGEVKYIAAKNGLSKIVQRKESMGICFIGKREFQNFIAEYIKPQEGLLIDVDNGKVLAQHKGKHNWTLGQRCRISGQLERYYIARKTSSQDIYISKGHNHPLLYSDSLKTSLPAWICSEPPKLSNGGILKCEFRFQHGKPLIKCSVFKINENELWVRLEKPLRALTPGQYAVLYKANECLGSARISNPGPSLLFTSN